MAAFFEDRHDIRITALLYDSASVGGKLWFLLERVRRVRLWHQRGTRSPMAHKTRIMYIECKAGGLVGPARIGRVTYSKTGATIYYQGKEFRSLKGAGFKANYYEVATGDEYWISGPRKDGQDSLYATNIAPEIDVDVSDEYWSQIRKPPKPKA
jgi:hypothetical protein